jgi:hypothetical protein
VAISIRDNSGKMGSVSDWDDLIAEFRALGGTAENIRLGTGPLGRGLFPIEAGKPVVLHTPDSLLVGTNDIVFENGTLKVSPEAAMGARERQFFEDYHAHLSWGAGGREEIERLFDEAQALPADLRAKFSSQYHLGSWFEDPTPELVQKNFIGSREYGYGDGDVMMPFIELANHGDACSYDTGGGIWLKGTPQGEATVVYSATDPYGFFRAWGFVTESPLAFSSELSGSAGKKRLFIERHTSEGRSESEPLIPKVVDRDEFIKLSFLLLGSRNKPRLCRGIFRRLLGALGFDTAESDETFDKIRSANHRHFLSLLSEIELLEGPMVRNLRRMVRYQLVALSYCFGARDI